LLASKYNVLPVTLVETLLVAFALIIGEADYLGTLDSSKTGPAR
jgi:hypothetical protein